MVIFPDNTNVYKPPSSSPYRRYKYVIHADSFNGFVWDRWGCGVRNNHMVSNLNVADRNDLLLLQYLKMYGKQ